MLSPLSHLSSLTYQHLVKPIFFQFDAETVHDLMVATGKTLGSVPPAKWLLQSMFAYDNPILYSRVAGIPFYNPIGLAAGFDYDANLTQILGSVGFGFQSIGTVTAQYYEGNQKPRLGRLPKSHSLLVNKGFKSSGINEIVKKLQPLQFPIPVGMSIGSTNKVFASDATQIDDYLQSFVQAEKSLSHISYYELNISCPNLKTGEPFSSPNKLRALLREVEQLHLSKPMFLKMPTDLSLDQSMQLLRSADNFTLAGAIFGNLTKDRNNPDLDPQEVAVAGPGNFSGKPTERRTNALLQSAYNNFRNRYIFIGCGGVFTAKDAYRKIRLGASLVQLITGMVYQGPQVIGQINQGLARLLQRDGYKHLHEAVGADNK